MSARAAILLAAGALNACALAMPDRIHYRWSGPAEAPVAPVAAPADRFVGLALSGGGSRSAVFASAALEALAEHGLLDQVTHISSVSGGGFAASYYLLRAPEGDDDFTAFRQAMRHDFLVDVALRQAGRPNRAGSPTRRLSSLRDALDAAFIGGATFADLPESPVFFVNASRYDDARRFVFSNLALADDDEAPAPLSAPETRAASFSAPGCARPTPPDFSLSLAIATSAAFPLVLGPATFEGPADCAGAATRYWHLGDGGVIENLGVETLEEVALRAIDAGAPLDRVVIISIDAERLPAPEPMFDDDDLSIWTSNPGRVVDVAMMRGRAYHDMIWPRVWADRGVEAEVIHARYTHARLGAWPASCGARAPDPAAIAAHVELIATSLRISDCNADLMEAAAHRIVHERLNARRDALSRLGVDIRTVPIH